MHTCSTEHSYPTNSIKCVSVRESEALDGALEPRFQLFTAKSRPATTHNPVLPHSQDIPQVMGV